LCFPRGEPFDNAPDVIFLCDSDGVFIDVNFQAEKLSGYSKEELIGKSFFDISIFSPEDIPRVAENQQISFMGGLGTSEYKIMIKNGETRHIQVIPTIPRYLRLWSEAWNRA